MFNFDQTQEVDFCGGMPVSAGRAHESVNIQSGRRVMSS